ncbi:HPr family phosphocarrier protein [Neobacillus cucumis]|uniref:HPr family phosphocarrier protein n=1 Tax=Neobacillus cucumis TaxID=1740721 RepID=UPI002E214564|nr:HPr family phosphocarrier protein [Neobacillus cucumis]MED4224596.1 HPr family phosphocarrier protein [Neobacillus cucumis]
MIEKQYKIIASTGFARPANLILSVADKFTSNLCLEFQGTTVELNYTVESIMDIMSLRIIPGAPFQIRAEGIDEQQALESIEEHLRNRRFIH